MLVRFLILIFISTNCVFGEDDEEPDFEILGCDMSAVDYYGYTCVISSANLQNSNVEILIGRLHHAGKNDSHVESVIFQSSTLSFVPMEIFDMFPNLRNLKIERVGLSKFNNFRNCEKLNKVEAWYNKITVLQDGIFTKCKNLKTLSLYSNQVERIEANVFHPETNLELWRMDANKVHSIDRNLFKNLKKIQSFQLSGSQCVSRNFVPITPENVNSILPIFENCFLNYEGLEGNKKIVECVMSTVDYFGYTCVLTTEVTENQQNLLFGRLHIAGKVDADVKGVIFQGSKMSRVPLEIFEMFPNLEKLKMERVNLPKINRLSNCSKLISFEAWYNQITVLEAGTFEECKNLKHLQLYSNQVTRLESGIFHPNAALTLIRLDSNKISSIARNFFKTTNNIASFMLAGNVCVTKNFGAITPENVMGVLPYFERCFRNYEKQVAV